MIRVCPSAGISGDSHARLLFTPLLPLSSFRRITTRVFFHSRRTTYVHAHALVYILCIDVCTHNISQIHLWHVYFFLPVPTLISIPWTILFSAVVYSRTRVRATEFWRSLITRRKRVSERQSDGEKGRNIRKKWIWKHTPPSWALGQWSKRSYLKWPEKKHTRYASLWSEVTRATRSAALRLVLEMDST